LSLRRFDGWVPRTRYEHDKAGRLVSSATESEWDEEQQAIMLALHRYRELVCKGCGGWLPETTAAEAEDRYAVEAPVRCHCCAAYSRARDRVQEMSRPESLLLQVRG
jgi:hypothetical protein